MLKKLFNIIFLCAFAVALCFTISSCGKDKGPKDKEYTPEELTELVNSFFDKLEAATLTEDDGSEKKEISLSINDISYTGNFDSKIDSFYYTPDTMYISGREKMESDGQEVENAYTIFTRAFENGNLRLDTNNGITNATVAVAGEEAMKSLQGVSDIDIAEVIKSFRIKESYIKTTDNARVYEFSGYYLENIIEALTGTDMLGDVDVSDMTVIADFTKFYSDKKVELTVKYNKKDVFVAHVDASKYEYNSGFDMDIELEGTEMKVSLGVFEDRAIKTSISLVSEESSVEFKYEYKGDKYTVSSDTPDKECDAYYLQIVMKEGKTEIINLELNAAMVEKGALKGAINCTAGLQEGIIPLSSSNGVHIEGTFGLQMSKDGIDTATAQLELDAGSLAKGHLVLAYNGANAKKVGEALLDITLTAANSPDQSLKVKTISYTEEKSSYAIEYIGEEGTARATLNYPATSYKLTETEEKYYQRAKKHFESFEETEKNMKKLNNAAADYVREGLNSDSALKYITKVDSDYAYLTEITLNGSIIYAYTSILVDYENYQFFYATNLGGLDEVIIGSKAPVIAFVEGISENTRFASNFSVHREGSYIVEAKIPNQNAYVYFEHRNCYEYTVSFVRLDSSYFDGKTIHTVSPEDDYFALHDFERTVTDCVGKYTCKECGHVAYNSIKEHKSGSTVLSELTDTNSKTVYYKCNDCGEFSLEFTDSKGTVLKAELVGLEERDANTYCITGDISKMLVVKPLYCETDIDGFDRVINFVQLPESEGKQIVAIERFFQDYTGKYKFPVDINLPEGIKALFYNASIFANIRSINLPEGLVFIASGSLEGEYIKELNLPKSLLYFYDNRLPNIEKIIINSEVMEFFHCGNDLEDLSKIVFNCESIKIFEYRISSGTETVVAPECVEIFRHSCNIKKVTLPYKMKELEDGTFAYSSPLEEVVLSDQLTDLKLGFYSCINLKTVKLLKEDGTIEGADGKILLPQGLIKLGSSFYNCDSIEEVNLPSGIEEIPSFCFGRCDNLKKVSFHNTVKTIHPDAFVETPNLRTVDFYGTEEEFLALNYSFGENVTVNFITDAE